MTISELIAVLKAFPPDLEVYIDFDGEIIDPDPELQDRPGLNKQWVLL